MATLKSWREGPMGFEWEHLTPEACDKKHDEMLAKHAKSFRKKGTSGVSRRSTLRKRS
jgi:hypothetical protein